MSGSNLLANPVLGRYDGNRARHGDVVKDAAKADADAIGLLAGVRREAVEILLRRSR